MDTTTATMTTKKAADTLGVSVHRVLQLLTDKILIGEIIETPAGKYWAIDTDSVTRYKKTRRRAGRPRGSLNKAKT